MVTQHVKEAATLVAAASLPSSPSIRGIAVPVSSSSTSSAEGVSAYIKKRSGGGDKARWEVWDGKAALYAESSTPCRWAELRLPTSGQQAPEPGRICLHPDGQDQFVSEEISKLGHWKNCDDLTELLHDNPRAVYVDLGANIGACVMQVLFTTQASIIAFEPNPANLFRLTSTLLNFPQRLKDRVTLFPVALGDMPGTPSIVSNPQIWETHR